MKKTITKESTCCDFCEKDSWEKCKGCEIDVCFECQPKEGIEFKPGAFHGGSGEGFYCNRCLSDSTVVNTPLFKAYKNIANLRAEYDLWWENFNIRAKIAEEKLKGLCEKDGN